MSETPRIDVRTRLDRDEVTAVLQLVADAAEADGVQPVSEHVYLHLRHGGDVADHNLLARSGDRLVGYAHLDPTDEVEGASAELVVAPAERGKGIGSALVEKLEELAPGRRLRLWAHGTQPAASALAAKFGFERARVLWQMRRSLLAPLPSPELPEGVAVRTFEPGRDEAAWIAVNSAAFATHPDQGGWSLEDLLQREREGWFDPKGFFLAERDARLLAFHWTKVHGHEHDHEPIGEVYVVGVHPEAQGLGLGKSMTLVGLHHLRSRGLAQVMLYVDESNTTAISLYQRLGFSRWDTDVSFRR